MKNKIKKALLIGLGLISLSLGIIGIILPLLPTTPFLLLSAFCFIRSSEKLYIWLISNKVFGKYIYNYIHYRAVTKTTKIISVLVLWVTLIISITLADNPTVTVILCIVGIGVSTHLLMLKTLE